MADVSVSTLVTGLVSGLLSSVLTYLGARSKIRLELTVEYDKKLRERRVELYRALWPVTKSLARYSRSGPLTYAVVRHTAEEFRDWYFDREGGLYLSRPSRKPYFELKKEMQLVIDDTAQAARPEEELAGARRDAILDAVSRLRDSLADDIGSRRSRWI